MIATEVPAGGNFPAHSPNSARVRNSRSDTTFRALREVPRVSLRRRIQERALWAACCPHCEQVERSLQPTQEMDR